MISSSYDSGGSSDDDAFRFTMTACARVRCAKVGSEACVVNS